MKPLDSLDQMKESWKLLSAGNLKKELSAQDIHKIIRQKSKSELDKIKRKLLIETIVSFSFIPFIVYYIHKGLTAYACVFDLYIIVTFIVFAIPALRLLKIGRFRNQETSAFLSKFVFHFEQTIRNTLIIASVYIPLGGIISGIAGFIAGMRGYPNPFPDIDISVTDYFDNPTVIVFVTIIIVVLVCLSALFIIKVYYILMYSKHIKNMKNFLNELNKIEKPDNDEKKYEI